MHEVSSTHIHNLNRLKKTMRCRQRDDNTNTHHPSDLNCANMNWWDVCVYFLTSTSNPLLWLLIEHGRIFINYEKTPRAHIANIQHFPRDNIFFPCQPSICCQKQQKLCGHKLHKNCYKILFIAKKETLIGESVSPLPYSQRFNDNISSIFFTDSIYRAWHSYTVNCGYFHGENTFAGFRYTHKNEVPPTAQSINVDIACNWVTNISGFKRNHISYDDSTESILTAD